MSKKEIIKLIDDLEINGKGPHVLVTFESFEKLINAVKNRRKK